MTITYDTVADTGAVEQAEEALARARTFSSSRHSMDRDQPEVFMWLLDSIASSLLAIAKRM